MVIRVHPQNSRRPSTAARSAATVRPNGGQNWTDLTGAGARAQKVHQDLHVLLMNPTDGDEFYIGGDGGLWRTTNGGTSFINANGNMNITQFYAVGTDASGTRPR